jgi:hypothetical protein
MRYYSFVLWLKYVNREPRVGGMFIGLFFGLAFTLFLFVQNNLPFLIDGETVQGKVISNIEAMVRYEYVDADGNNHIGEQSTSVKDRNPLKSGDQISVRYLRSNPSRSLIMPPYQNLWANSGSGRAPRR